MARKSFCEIYIHLVWQTKYRRELLRGPLELFVHRRLREFARQLQLTPLAVNSAWDHVHAYYRWHPSVSVADAVRTLKSKTSLRWNEQLDEDASVDDKLKWQVGYGAVSTRKSDVSTVQDYIDNQKQRHRDDKTWEPYERVEFDETAAAA